MMRSMFSGVSGLRNHQLRMDVIGNNIANVNTFGYKASRANFSDMFNQNLKAAAPMGATTGGTNAKQVGLGVQSSGIDVLHTEAAAQVTDRALDLAIQGEGFFICTKGDISTADPALPDEYYYSRAGNLYLDTNGYLVNSDGLYILGILFDDYHAALTDGSGDYGGISGVPKVQVDQWAEDLDTGNLNGSGYADLNDFNDAVGGWNFGGLGEGPAEYPMYRDTNPGTVDSWREFNSGNPLIGPGTIFSRIAIPPSFRNLSIDENGVILAMDQTNEIVKIGVIATATFMNPGGLEKVGGNLYKESANSGAAGIGFPGLGPNGGLKPGALEMSNVDLSKEFTDMIITQRGFQSNSRIITVSDTLLEELVNLKR